jgi:hypothetical protein
MSNNVISVPYGEAAGTRADARVVVRTTTQGGGLARWKLANLTLGYDVNPFQGNFCPKNASQRCPKRLMFPTLFLSCDAALGG